MTLFDHKAMNRGAGYAASLFFIAGCASGGFRLPDAESDGARLYVEQCSVCHAVPHPKRHRADEWPHYVELMEKRMAQRDKTPLSDEDRSMILEYLTQHAR